MKLNSIAKNFLFLIVALAFTSAPAFSKDTPDATLTLEGGSVAAGIGVQWGTGTLTYKGKSYPIKYNGLSLGEIGGSGKNISGEVYDLKAIKDFEGRYAAVKAGAAAAAGGEVSTMSNDKGVTVKLHGIERGLKLTLGAEGMKFTLAE